MKITKLLAVLAIAGITFVGCSKDDDNSSGTNTPSLSKTQLLTGHSWTMTGTYFDGVELPMDTCDMDNIYTWNVNGIYTEDAGAYRCDTAEPQIIETNSWNFNYNQTKVIFAAGTVDEDSATILQLDANSLRYQYSYNDSLFGQTNIEIRFTKR